MAAATFALICNGLFVWKSKFYWHLFFSWFISLKLLNGSIIIHLFCKFKKLIKYSISFQSRLQTKTKWMQTIQQKLANRRESWHGGEFVNIRSSWNNFAKSPSRSEETSARLLCFMLTLARILQQGWQLYNHIEWLPSRCPIDAMMCQEFFYFIR